MTSIDTLGLCSRAFWCTVKTSCRAGLERLGTYDTFADSATCQRRHHHVVSARSDTRAVQCHRVLNLEARLRTRPQHILWPGDPREPNNASGSGGGGVSALAPNPCLRRIKKRKKEKRAAVESVGKDETALASGLTGTPSRFARSVLCWSCCFARVRVEGGGGGAKHAN